MNEFIVGDPPALDTGRIDYPCTKLRVSSNC